MISSSQTFGGILSTRHRFDVYYSNQYIHINVGKNKSIRLRQCIY